MPDYKKKKHSKLSAAPKSKKPQKTKADNYEEIKMSPSKSGRSSEDSENIKVIKGKKAENRRRLKISAIVSAVIIAAVIIFETVLPAGIIDTVSGMISVMGVGGYPVELQNSDILDVVQKGSYYYILSATDLRAYSNSGKQLFAYSHGFENPVLKTAASKSLLFDQGGKEILIFDLKKLKYTVTTEKEILTANISDSGNYAVATFSDKYASEVTVYKKNGNELYEWYSAEDMVNNVALSSSGKKLAVSVFNAVSGKYRSKLSILGFDSAVPLYSETLEDTIVYTLDTTYRNGIFAVTSNSTEHIKWSKYQKTEYKSDYNSAFSGSGKGGYFTVFNRDSNRTDNKIAVFTTAGKLKYEISYNGIISDIALYGGHIYCISNTDVYMLDTNGSVLKSAECGFSPQGLSVTGEDTAAVITDEKAETVNLIK